MGKKRSISRKEIIYRQVDNYSDDERCKLDRYISNLETWILYFINMNGLVSSIGCHYEKASVEFALSKLRYNKYHDIPEVDYEAGALIFNDSSKEERENAIVFVEDESTFVEHIVQKISGIKYDCDSSDYYRVHAEGISFARNVFGEKFQSVIYTCFEEGVATNHIMVCRYGMENPVELRLNRSFRKRIERINDELRDHFGFSMRWYLATEHECWPDIRDSFIPQEPMGFWFDEKSMTFDLEWLGIPGGGHLVFDMKFDEEGLTASPVYCDNKMVWDFIREGGFAND